MLTLSTSMHNMLMGHTTSYAYIISIIKTDGVGLYFTNFNQNLVFEGNTYIAKGGFDASAIDSNSDLTVDTVNLTVAITDSAITGDDVNAGLYSGAPVTLSFIDYEDLSDGNSVVMQAGTVGNITFLDTNNFQAEIVGIEAAYASNIGTRYTPTCTVRRLGDVRCKINTSPYTFDLTVASVTNSTTFNHNTDLQAMAYFTYGVLTWVTGLNAGQTMDIKSYELGTGSAQFILQLPLNHPITIGDTFTATAGCDRLFSTCQNTYNNVENFRGFKDIPGLDSTLQQAS